MSIPMLPPVQYSSLNEILDVLINKDFNAFSIIFQECLFPKDEKKSNLLVDIIPPILTSLLNIHILKQWDGPALLRTMETWKQESLDEISRLSIDAIAREEQLQTLSYTNLHGAINVALNSIIDQINRRIFTDEINRRILTIE